MENDLAHVDPATPVIIFIHDAPEVSAKHFINPNGKHDLNAVDKFENLLADTLIAGDQPATIESSTVAEQMQWEEFLHRHSNLTAYFHGDSNWTQFYDWTGPNRSVALHTFRVDSPMKGHFSAADETRLAFDVVTIDPVTRTMTVREVLWNADPQHPSSPAWGASTTVALAPLR